MSEKEELQLDSFPSLTKGLTEEQLLKISQLSKEGYQLIKKDRLNEAEQVFKEILTLDDNNNYALVGLGDILRKKGQASAAILYYQKCLNNYPSNNYALFGLADCYKTLKNYSRAIEIWEEYLKYDTRNITVLTRVADAYRKVGNFSKSRETYLKTLEKNPENEYAFIGLGHLFYDFKEFEQALFYWKKVYEKYQDHVDMRVLTSIGNCYRKLKQFDEGISYFKKALELSPNNFYALFGLGDCYRGLGLLEESKNCWQEILRKDPKNKVVLTRLGDTYRLLGQLEQAEHYYTQALKVDFDAYAALGLAIVHKEQGLYEESIEALNSLLNLNPKNSRVYLELSECYEKQGRIAEAIRILYQFLEKGIHNLAVMERYEKLKSGYLQTDTHCHLYSLLEKDQAFLFKYERMFNQGFLQEIWDIGLNEADYPIRKKALRSLTAVRFSIGVHPSKAHEQFIDQDKLSNWAREDEKIILIGETGLDFFKSKSFAKEQELSFIKHIELANWLNKPIVAHVRLAEERFLKLITSHKVKAGGIWHCFSANYEQARQAIDLGFKISFAGNLTYKKNYNIQETARKLALETLLIETDAPYLAPVPVRGEMNHSGNLLYTLTYLAKLRNLDVEEMSDQIRKNIRQLLN
ncbi:UNVERIFIED_CONTAM: hypothetical protein PYX00_010871 [Menopon gallinae]|uniref:Uncharacterized protein n=1 Tax=Menopon gallinae TaxID=328185 RepID=A0AAW2H6G6_9NEOP